MGSMRPLTGEVIGHGRFAVLADQAIAWIIFTANGHCSLGSRGLATPCPGAGRDRIHAGRSFGQDPPKGGNPGQSTGDIVRQNRADMAGLFLSAEYWDPT